MDARRLLRRVASGAALLLASLGLPVQAGDLSHADIARRFQPPLHVGDKLRDIPAWPITSELEPEAGPVAYAFESIDLAPIPGFEGTPMNLLVSIDRKGNFMDVALLRQHEPVFLSGLGEGPLRDFLAQYANKSLKQEITVSSLYGNTRAGAGGNRVVLDGVSKATASVRIVNQTVLTSALAVARARLGFAAPAEKGPLAEVKADVFDRRSFAELLASGAIGRLHLSHADVEQRFAGSDGAGVDAEALARPGETFIDLYVAYLNAPTIGRAILGETGHADLMRRLEPGQHAWWVASAGRDAYIDEDFTRGTVPARLAFSQAGAPVELRDLDLSPRPPEGAPPLNAALVLRVPPMSGIDPASPVRFELTLTRAKGSMLPVLTQRSVSLDYQAPEALFFRPPAPLPDWLIAWKERGVELGIIAAALALLSVVLARPRWISVSARRLKVFRLAFLAFTLGYIGWYAQGQLSIVQITGAIKSLVAGRSEELSLRPGLAAADRLHAGQLLGLGPRHLLRLAVPLRRAAGIRRHGSAAPCACPQIKLPARLAGVLDRGRFVILAALPRWPRLAAPSGRERRGRGGTLQDRDHRRLRPHLALCGLCADPAGAGRLYYKFFCRYLCPLGAAMVLGGKLRRSTGCPAAANAASPARPAATAANTTPSRKAAKSATTRCFQCLDCVGIYHDPGRCAPIMLMHKKDKARNAG
jgi:NosR/NirI family nitrous oxide reductase transcriptional regulator